MTSDITIQLGEDESKVSLKTTPTVLLHITYEYECYGSQYGIVIYLAYYIKGMLEYPLIKVRYEWLCLKVDSSLSTIHCLKEFIQDMENNESCECKKMSWDATNNLWKHKMNINDTLQFRLCAKSKKQFIRKLRGSLYVMRGVYIKKMFIHPAIIAKRVLAEI